MITRPAAPAGRGRRRAPSPVAELAAEAGVAGAHARSVPASPSSSPSWRALDVDCCPVVAYGALLPPAALDVPPHGWVNLHFSLLPAWRGAAPVQHAILHGDEITGARTFLIEAGLDTGPVFGVVTEPIRPHRHRRRPARAAGRQRRRAAGGDDGRHRRRLAGRPCRSRPTGCRSPAR